MSTVNESVFMRALKREPVARTPVWMMRQAGRYLPEYRATRAQAGDFMSLCKTPELACEVTLQPFRRFALDAAILFSDILTIPDAMGLGLHFVEGEGPCFERPLKSLEAIEKLRVPAPETLEYVMDAVRHIRRALPEGIPLIGFAGSPWTLACYMLEGGSSKDFRHAQSLLYREPRSAHLLLQTLAEAVTDYLSRQVEAGANALMVFDTWGGILSPEDYVQFSCAYMQRIVEALKERHPEVPVTLFSKGAHQSLERQAQTGCNALGIDWTLPLSEARRRVGSEVVLQGNLNPAILLTSPDCIRTQVERVLKDFGQGEGHIFNLGHGVTPDVPVEHVEAMIESVHALSPHYHQSF
ncbi:uroporphyrinogen decarboxylase [Legionella geestiana]|uniref:Uroporphyrinogen decarboxylase n=1 Tax=Legionella geestiana TaxID=45065 RepID=A0A0W0U432_9GAMM|nr:uroporphyrinogen decarboxylase [Legionella geestiana]KTD02664.1 uroporphyrinogen decarboxylase [Legionella geestiana]QBS12740.1 uroporphyrinogen decarboxylase [Legionella geestiana]QDQ39545.1 uroporphyrinogen decarboxylase [Legionella geestiana]STX54792.1 uroporphyrinogen decarboxylase [Legionella geestiana]